jgi:hypothetical protein
MARILINNTWYEQIEPSTFNETEFEDYINLHAPLVYPFYHVIPFKKKVSSLDPISGNVTHVIPDLAFISKDYNEWWVVEVEMTYHNLNNHVIPQIEALKRADYSLEVAEYLAEKKIDIDLNRLHNLIKTSEVQVLVIVNQNNSQWIKELSKRQVVTAVFELFRGEDGIEIFRVNGEYPVTLIEMMSSCTFHPTIPRFIAVDNPETLQLPASREIVRLKYNNCLTEWRRLDSAGKVWLQPVGRNPLNNRHRYQIYRQDDDTLVLRQTPESENRSYDEV